MPEPKIIIKVELTKSTTLGQIEAARRLWQRLLSSNKLTPVGDTEGGLNDNERPNNFSE